MDFLASPIHNCSFETFDDALFDLPKEMDFELNGEFRDTVAYNGDDDDLNNGMYGMWNNKHPWSISTSSTSLYSSNLHLDFIGGDPESAMMVNPNVVIPNGFQNDEDSVRNNGIKKSEVKDALPVSSVSVFPTVKIENTELLNEDALTKKNKIQFSLIKEDNVENDNIKNNVTKNNIRTLKPAIDSSSSVSVFSDNQLKIDTNNRLKNTSPSIKTGTVKCNYYYQNETFYPKPAFSYSCLIAMALKNSKHGCLPVAEIYNFMCNHFPYFKTAPNGWKNSVRHNLSLNKCFEKIEKPAGSTQRKGCLWALNPSKASKLEDEVQKWTKKDATAIKRSMEYPEHLELLEKGELKSLYDTEQSIEDDDDVDMEENDLEDDDTNRCEDNEEDDCVDERYSETDDQDMKQENQIQVSYVGSATNDISEFNIEVDDSIYEELIGTIENEELFSINTSSLNGSDESYNSMNKKIHKFYLNMNGKTIKKNTCQEDEPEFDHYDINNFLRFENDSKLSAKKHHRFNKRVSTNSRIKQIKFKTWN